MDLQELMKTNVENLAQMQHNELKEHTIKTLKKILNTIKLEEYDKIEDLLFPSPAGDGYGLDNDCINFHYSDGKIMDIGEITEFLKNLKH